MWECGGGGTDIGGWWSKYIDGIASRKAELGKARVVGGWMGGWASERGEYEYDYD